MRVARIAKRTGMKERKIKRIRVKQIKSFRTMVKKTLKRKLKWKTCTRNMMNELFRLFGNDCDVVS